MNYTDTGPLEIAGIDHKEIVVGTDGIHEVTRWKFAGSISFTVAALSSLERDRLFDEMVRVIAFARVEQNNISAFRKSIENNDFLGINMQFDTIEVSGDSASPGTPWGTEETIYEIEVSTDVIGEFVSDPATNNLVALSQVVFEGYLENTPTPNFPDQADNGSGIAFSPWM